MHSDLSFLFDDYAEVHIFVRSILIIELLKSRQRIIFNNNYSFAVSLQFCWCVHAMGSVTYLHIFIIIKLSTVE